jgi:histidinol-phosphate aminotransferase
LIIRDVVQRIKPYEWEASNTAIAEKFNINIKDILRFDTNVMPYPPTELLSKLGSILDRLEVNGYPDTSYRELRQRLAKYLGRKPEQITVTTGCDEALDILAKTFIDPRTETIDLAPSYAMYRFVVEALGGFITTINRKDDFSIDEKSLLKAVNPKTRIIFICNPNNPTANVVNRESLLGIVENVDCPVVIDESYVEFCDETAVNLVEENKNLIVLRTFSKAFSLAGARVGYIIAHEQTVKVLNVMRPPNSLSVISLTLANLAMDNVQYMKKNVKKIILERERLRKKLNEINSIYVYPSHTNFILIKFRDKPASEVYMKLLEKGIVPKSLSDMPMVKDCLRFSVRTPDEDSRLIEALTSILSG